MANQNIVLVAGLYSPAWVFIPLARRLRAIGYKVSVFSRHYPSYGGIKAAHDLREHLQAIESDKLHLVAHSFGGIVLLHLFDRLAESPDPADSELLNRIASSTFIASPLAGAQLAEKLLAGRAGLFWKHVLGKSLHTGLLGNAAGLDIPANSAFITGEKKSVFSKLLSNDVATGDGLVRLVETRVVEQPADAHVSLPLSHAGLLFSKRCVALIDQFIRADGNRKSAV